MIDNKGVMQQALDALVMVRDAGVTEHALTANQWNVVYNAISPLFELIERSEAIAQPVKIPVDHDLTIGTATHEDARRFADAIDPFVRKKSPDHLTLLCAAKTLRDFAQLVQKPSDIAQPEQITALDTEITTLRQVAIIAGQVLRDMQAQDLLIEWQTALEEAIDRITQPEQPAGSDALMRLKFFRDLSDDERFKVLNVFGVVPEGVTASDMNHNVERRLLDKALQAIAQPEQQATAAQAEITKSDMVYLYWAGYTTGHHDTVEGQYTDVTHHYARSHHAEVVDELISEGNIAQPEQTAESDDLTIVYMSGFADGKKVAQQKEKK